MAIHRLVVIDGRLYFPHGGFPDATGISSPQPNEPALLLRVYDAGDCDTCPWPMQGEHHHERLRIALFDERECNEFWKAGDTIELPDGTPFNID